MPTINVSDESFESDVLGSDTPVLVDFWAEWCAPCKQIAPALEELSAEFEGQVKIAKINIDDAPETPAKFHIRGVPTLMIFKGGEVVATKSGPHAKTVLSDWIKENMDGGDAA